MKEFNEHIETERDKAVNAVLRLHEGEILLRHYANDEIVNERKYLSRIEVLDKYIAFINKLSEKADTRSLGSRLKRIFSNNQFEELLSDLDKYEFENIKDLNNAFKCSECKCIECAIKCPFRSCYYCTSDSKVIACDKENNCIRSSNKKEELYVHEFEKDCTFDVIGKLVNIECGKQKEYMYLQDEEDSSNEQIVGYRLSTTGTESFISLSEEELDKIYQIYLNLKVGN